MATFFPPLTLRLTLAADFTQNLALSQFVGAFFTAIKMLAVKQRKRMYKKREPEKERGKTGKGRELDAILAFLTPSPTLL